MEEDEVAGNHLRLIAGVTVGLAVAVGLWVLWTHFADMVAYRAPYGLWLCEIDNGGVIGDPFIAIGRLGLKLVLLPASFAVVALVAIGTRLRDRRMWVCFAAAVAMVCLVTLGYVAAVDGMLHPTYDVPECS